MEQQSLFIEKPPKRIELYRDFISEREEEFLLEKFKSLEWQTIMFRGVIAKRRVAHFGLDYIYDRRAVNQTDPPPVWLDFLTERVAKLIHVKAKEIKEVLVTNYPAGSGIGWHKDAEVFGDAIVGVSLLSDCTMSFKNPKTAAKYKLFIPRRSAYLFAGEARQLWHHSITSHKLERYSITFRTL